MSFVSSPGPTTLHHPLRKTESLYCTSCSVAFVVAARTRPREELLSVPVQCICQVVLGRGRSSTFLASTSLLPNPDATQENQPRVWPPSTILFLSSLLRPPTSRPRLFLFDFFSCSLPPLPLSMTSIQYPSLLSTPHPSSQLSRSRTVPQIVLTRRLPFYFSSFFSFSF